MRKTVEFIRMFFSALLPLAVLTAVKYVRKMTVSPIGAGIISSLTRFVKAAGAVDIRLVSVTFQPLSVNHLHCGMAVGGTRHIHEHFIPHPLDVNKRFIVVEANVQGVSFVVAFGTAVVTGWCRLCVR